MIYVTSDLHFCHHRPFLYEPRGFISVEEMNEAIVENWNRIVGKDDIVYCLGDLMLNDNIAGIKLIESLNGKIKVAIGNHDSNNRLALYKQCKNISDIQFSYCIKELNNTFLLSHYPMLTGNGKEYSPISLCGHSHTQDPFFHWKMDGYSRIYHCELDAHNCEPISLKQILSDIHERQKGEQE